MEVDVRRAAGSGKSLVVGIGVAGVLAMSACSSNTTMSAGETGQPTSPTSSTSPPGKWVKGSKVKEMFYWKDGKRLRVPNCPDESNRTTCIYGTNEVSVFSGPNQLSGAAFSLVAQGAEHGVFVNNFVSPWTPSSPGSNLPYLAKLDSDGAGSEGSAIYAPPGNLPQGDQVAADFANPLAGSDDVYCNGPTYTSVTCSTTGGDDGNFFINIGNLPLTIAIANNLAPGDTLTMSGGVVSPGHPASPTYVNLLSDPVGGNPQTIAPGTIGYEGMYMQVYGSTGEFSTTYALPSDSPDLAGTTIGINISITTPGTLDPSSTCKVNLGSSEQAAFCDLSIIGTSAQTVTVNVHQ